MIHALSDTLGLPPSRDRTTIDGPACDQPSGTVAETSIDDDPAGVSVIAPLMGDRTRSGIGVTVGSRAGISKMAGAPDGADVAVALGFEMGLLGGGGEDRSSVGPS